MKKADSYDEVDWSQFKKGDQFTGLVATTMMRIWPVIVSISAPYHPDMELVIKDMMDNNGQDLDDLGVDMDDTKFEEGRVYDTLFELTADGEEGENLEFMVVRAVPVSVRQTLQPRVKTDGMTQHDRDKAVAAATGGEVESNTAAVEGMLPIKW
jgi:hypothetical protein